MLRLIALCLLAASCFVPVSNQGPAYANNGYAPQQTCLMGSNGVQACGYDCKLGSDGVAACAQAPGGRCDLGTNGQVYCSQPPEYQSQSYGPQPQQQCELNSDGSKTCGYNCQLGSNGYHYCASTPDGRCGMNSDGTWSCS